jgi:hypothetical protein
MSLSLQDASCCWLHWRFVAMCVVGFLAAEGCAETPVGEFTAIACMDDEDNDDDKLVDCDDPDCWVFCPYRGGFMLGDASSSPRPDASFDAMPPPVADSGKSNGMMDDDAGTEPVDASLDDDAGTVPSCECAPEEECVDGQCRPAASPSIEGTYTLSVKSAYVPLGPSIDRCFDYSGAACGTRIPLICECERPDTYVVVVLNGTVLMKATTAAVRDTASPVWTTAPTVTIDLKATDKLTFIAFDQDTIQDQQIFSCVPVLSTLESGTDSLSCNPRPGMTVDPPANSNYFITVNVRRVVPDASAP